MTPAELHAAADRAEVYPPGHALNWGSHPSFCKFAGDISRFLANHPELLEAG